MIAIHCANCRHSTDVVASLAGCLVRCPKCDGVLRVPKGDEQGEGLESEYLAKEVVENPHREPEVQEYVDRIQQRVELERKQQPYRRPPHPDRLYGPIVITLGVLLMISIVTSDLGPMTMLVRFLFAGAVILFGVVLVVAAR